MEIIRSHIQQVPEAVRNWRVERALQRAEKHEKQSIRKTVRARRIEAAARRNEKENSRYTVERELVIPSKFYQGEPPLASILVTVTPLNHFRRVNKAGVENWCAVARLAPAQGQEAARDSSQPVLGEMTCAGENMSQEEAKARADLWINDSYPLIHSFGTAPIPQGTRAAAATEYSIQQPPVATSA